MKKLLFLLLALAGVAAFVSCGKEENPEPTPEPEDPITLPTLPDPEDVCSCMDDEVFKRYCLGFDTNHDGKLSRDEAAAATKMSLIQIYPDLKSLPGIGYFSNLKELSCLECKQLETVDLSNNLKLAHVQMSNCPNLKSIVLPNSLTAIAPQAFKNCTSLTNIHIPDEVTEIGEYAFCNCRYLKNINIPEGVTSIGSYAFAGCENVTSLNIPEGVTEIQDHTFYICRGLTKITIPANVTTIGDYAFAECSSLTSNMVIPGKVTEIGKCAFEGCYLLHRISISSAVTSIGRHAFWNCYLEEVYCKPVVPPTIYSDLFNYVEVIYVPYASVEAYKTARWWVKYIPLIKGF